MDTRCKHATFPVCMRHALVTQISLLSHLSRFAAHNVYKSSHKYPHAICTHIHTCMNTYIHSYTHARSTSLQACVLPCRFGSGAPTHTCIHTYIQSHTFGAPTHTCIYTYIQSHTFGAPTHTCIHTYIQSHTFGAPTHTCIHTYTQSHTHTHARLTSLSACPLRYLLAPNSVRTRHFTSIHGWGSPNDTSVQGLFCLWV